MLTLFYMSVDKDTYSISFDVDDPNCTAFAQKILSEIDLNGTITRIGFEVESTEPFEIELESASMGDDDVEMSTDDAEKSTSREADCTAEDESNRAATLTRFRVDSSTWPVVQMFYERKDEGFLGLDEIQQFTPDEAGIPDGRFSSICWDLADRGLLEKKKDPDDGRRRIYKLTGKGVDSVEATMEKEATA